MKKREQENQKASASGARWLALILAGYLLLTLAYGVVNPLFEAPDEHWHFFTALYIKENGRLPIAGPDTDDNLLKQQAAQPPLYYALGALLIAPIDTRAAAQEVWLNPYASVGDASVLTNRNRAIHGPQEEWPWRGYALAARVLRAFSALLGLGTLLCIYGAARLMWRPHPEYALLGTAVVAFLPQFNFLHASITNDALITFLCSAALYQILRSAECGQRLTDHALLGLTIGLAALSKNAGILLALYGVGITVAWSLFSGGWWFIPGKKNAPAQSASQSPKSLIAHGQWLIAHLGLLLTPILLLAGWLWWRNWTLYGDITATSEFVRFAGGDRGYTLAQVLAESGGLWQSLFAIFGWFNVRPPDWLFWLWYGVVATAVAGGIKAMVNGQWSMVSDQRGRRTLAIDRWLLAMINLGWFALVYAGLVAFMLRTEAAQGRLLFPAIVPMALALTYGLSRWLPTAAHSLAPSLRSPVTLIPWLAAFTSLYALFGVIAPTYAPPPVLAELPAGVERREVNLGEGLLLLGAEVETAVAHPGNPIWLTLYWQAQTPPAAAPAFKLEMFGRELTRIANLHSYHGRGLYPASLWPPGGIVADRFGVYVEETAVAPVWGRLFVRLAEGETAVAVGGVKIVPRDWPQTGAALAQLGESVTVTAVTLSATTARPGDTITVDVTWRVLAPLGGDYTTLLHLALPGQPPLAQGDSPPLAGQYPTRLWAAGEVIVDQYTLVVPDGLANGRYPLWLGLYDPQTLARLPVTVDGKKRPSDMLQIGALDIDE